MSENNKPGREPFERWTFKQDFCQLEYGVGACYAARADNLLLWSEDLENAYWDTATYSTVVSDTKTASNGVVLSQLEEPGPSSNYGIESDFETDVPRDTTYTASMFFEPKSFVSTPSTDFTLYVRKNLTGGGVSNEFATLSFNTETPSVISLSAFADDGGIEEIVPGELYRVYVTATISGPSVDSFDMRLFITGFRSGGMYQGGMQISRGFYPFPYTKTTDEAVYKTGETFCYNTRATCQVPDVYDRGELPLKFCKNQQALPRGEYHIPSVVSGKITPGSINPGGSDGNTTALGKRSTISVTFQDHTHSGLLVDPYRERRGYDPKERGTFWTKWRARNPYYMHRELVYESGYLLDGEIVDSIERTFVVTGFSGPDSSGRVTMSGKDVLALAANDKAKAPLASTGKLDGDITDFATTFTLTPVGVGDLEYPAAGWVRVGKEVMEFTRVGDDFTITRAQFGTEADEHEENDAVQLCLRYESDAPADILYDLLLNYANVPVGFLDKTQWDAEQLSYLPRKYSTIITEPEGVSDLVSEMCQQMYFTTWFDERESLVKMRAVRPAQGDAIYELNDNTNFVQDSITWSDKADELITQVWVYYGQSNPTEKLDQGDNYAALDVIASPDSEGEDRNNLSRIKTIYSRWIDSANGAAALDLGNRILARYASAPRECTFKLDAKDRDVWLADFVRLTNRLRTDFDGNQVPVKMQVFEAQETTPGTTFTYKAKEYIEQLTDGDDVQDPNVRNIIISADQLNVNLRELHDSQYAPPTGVETITCTIRSGVTIGGYAADDRTNIPYAQRDTNNDFYDGGTGSVSGLTAGQIPILQRRGISSVRITDSGDPYPEGGGNADFEIQEYPISTAFDTGDWPAGVTLNLVIEGGAKILGEGGNGSAHGLSGAGNFNNCRLAASGGDGGSGLAIKYPVIVTNGGVIAGGGGGGACYMFFTDNVPARYANIPGGGGAGFEISDTSTVKNATGIPGTTRQPSQGSSSDGGSGGIFRPFASFDGGSGGGLAEDGFAATRTALGVTDATGALGGTAGDAIAEGADMVTWVNKGDVRGAENI